MMNPPNTERAPMNPPNTERSLRLKDLRKACKDRGCEVSVFGDLEGGWEITIDAPDDLFFAGGLSQLVTCDLPGIPLNAVVHSAYSDWLTFTRLPMVPANEHGDPPDWEDVCVIRSQPDER